MYICIVLMSMCLVFLKKAKRELVSEADPRLQYEVDYNRPLGKGGFGEVYLAKHKTRGETVAIKQLQISKKNRMEYLLIETDLHARVSQHKNVVRFIDAFLLRDEKQVICFIQCLLFLPFFAT